MSRRDAGHTLIPSVVRCPVVDTTGTGHPDWNTLIVGYQDPDGGVGDQHRVRVRLLEVGRPSGVRPVHAFDSRRWTATGRTEAAVFFLEDDSPLNFVRFSYFLEISLSRGDLLGNPRIWHLRLATMRSQ